MTAIFRARLYEVIRWLIRSHSIPSVYRAFDNRMSVITDTDTDLVDHRPLGRGDAKTLLL